MVASKPQRLEPEKRHHETPCPLHLSCDAGRRDRSGDRRRARAHQARRRGGGRRPQRGAHRARRPGLGLRRDRAPGDAVGRPARRLRRSRTASRSNAAWPEMPTAFVASYGKGRPIIGILGEYDALPGISQNAAAHEGAARGREPRATAAATTCFGAASLGAAMAIKELIAAGRARRAPSASTARRPRSRSAASSTWSARACSTTSTWRSPGTRTTRSSADTESSQAMVDFVVEFQGRTAHAAVRSVERPQRARRRSRSSPSRST